MTIKLNQLLKFANKKRFYREQMSLNDNIRHNIYINNHKKIFTGNEIEEFVSGPYVKNKQIISLSPGGYKGFYVLGICKFIKENYDLENYVFSGASAGAWNSLLLCFKNDINDIINMFLNSKMEKYNSINELEKNMKNLIISKYTTNNFDLNKLYVGVTVIDKYKTNTTIYTGFENLEDAVNSCIASSHIPLITGGLTYFYRNVMTFDGGFSKYPYLNTSTSVLHIHPNMWNHFSNTTGRFNITDYTTLFSKSKYPFHEMIYNGYADSKKNRDILDKVFTKKNI